MWDKLERGVGMCGAILHRWPGRDELVTCEGGMEATAQVMLGQSGRSPNSGHMRPVATSGVVFQPKPSGVLGSFKHRGDMI